MVGEKPTTNTPLTESQLVILRVKTHGGVPIGEYAAREIGERRDEVQRLKRGWIEYDAKIVLLLRKNAQLKEELEMYKRAPETVASGHDTIVLK